MTGLLDERLSVALSGRYRIERELGAGGMATVYLAHDEKHDRDVAIKVLHPELAAALGGERFLAEIKTTARLQHPHILPLLDSGEANGLLYYVMPLVTGETLRARLERERQLAVDDALRIAREVADALGAAHASGIVHRDIKPENILLQGGHALVADFGIALAVQHAGGQRMTQTGLSLGTPQYMSPEQAMGERTIDARSDVYALGAVTYEMLSGDPPFIGSTVQGIVAKVLTEKPAPLAGRRERVTPAVEYAVLTALEKLPADRFASAAEFAAALGGSSTRETGMVAARGGKRVAAWGQRAALPATALSVVLTLALGWMALRPIPPAPVARYQVEMSVGQELSGSPWSRLAVSPDGSTLVYSSDGEKGPRLMVRRQDQLDAVALGGTDGAINPAVSPDGKRVAFMDRPGGGRIMVVPLAGGLPVAVTDSAVGAPGVAWGSDGFIYYDHTGNGPLMRVAESGGRAESVSRLDSAKGEQQHNWPDVLPSHRGVIMTVSRGGPGGLGTATDEIGVLDLSTHKHRTLFAGILARYARSGHLVYVTAEGALKAVPFDEKRMEITGEPVTLEQNVSIRSGNGSADLTISAGGTLWYTSGTVANSGTFEVVWVTRDGKAVHMADPLLGLFSDPVLSPDGKQLAVAARNSRSQIRVKQLEEGPLAVLSVGVDESSDSRAAWWPDGKSVAFVSRRGDGSDIYRRPTDGSLPASLLLHDPRRPVAEILPSHDGKWLIYRTGSAGDDEDLYARRVDSDSTIALATSPGMDAAPAISPDGRWLAYVSRETGTSEVYVRPFPNIAGGRWQISAQGGVEPVWAHSGKELFYRSTGASSAQMVMSVTTGSTFVPGERRVLFPLGAYVTATDHQQYTVSPDDQRFVMIRPPERSGKDHLILVDNFFEVLKKRAPPR